MAVSTFRIAPRLPFLTLLIAAACALSGAALLVVALANRLPFIAAVLGGVALVIGAVLCGGALLGMRNRVVTLTVDDEGYQLSGAEQNHAGTWAGVTKVVSNDSGSRITIEEGEKRTHLVFAGGDLATAQKVAAEIAHRLQIANP